MVNTCLFALVNTLTLVIYHMISFKFHAYIAFMNLSHKIKFEPLHEICNILTSVDSREPLQPPFKLRNSQSTPERDAQIQTVIYKSRQGTILQWNQLPSSVVTVDTVECFRKALTVPVLIPILN